MIRREASARQRVMRSLVGLWFEILGLSPRDPGSEGAHTRVGAWIEVLAGAKYTRQAVTAAEIAAHHRRWLASIPEGAPTMASAGQDGNLYFDDDETFWREVPEHGHERD